MKNHVRFGLFILLALLTACSGPKALTVAEAVQDAERLDGHTIRVRGLAYLWVDPSQAEMWMFGGCMPTTDPNYGQGVVKGWLTLYDSIDPEDIAHYGVPYEETGIKISESYFHCGGNYCGMTCSSFEVVSQRMYEFVGRLQVDDQSGLILEELDLDQSSQLVDGNWTTISNGNFEVMFP